MKKKKRKLKIIISSLVGLVVIAGIGVYLYFSLGTRVVNGLDGLENLDPNDNRPVEVNLTEEDIAKMTDEEKEEYGVNDVLGDE